jgi:hypothetical protein
MTQNWVIDTGDGSPIAFGSQESGFPFSDAPEIGDPTRVTQDASLAGVDGSIFGIDTTEGRTIAFELTALGDDDAEAAALYGAFNSKWRDPKLRATAGAVATLTSPRGRSAFGRPRRITPKLYPNDAGAVGITADFVTTDDLWYGAAESLSVPLALTQSGGLVEPLTEPLVAQGYTTSANTFVVGGTEPTWPILTLRGQILNPGVRVDGLFAFSAQTSLAFDEWLTIDTRPGIRSVLRNGERIASLTRGSSLLSDAALTPGAHTLVLTGSASTGSPTATIAWRAAYSTH